MKCEYTDESGPCTRCRTNEHACEVEPRKHTSQKKSVWRATLRRCPYLIGLRLRSARSALLRQVQRKDALIASLLRHVYSTMEVGQQQAADSDGSVNAGDEHDAVGAAAPHPETVSSSSAAGQDVTAVKREPSVVPASMPASAFRQACAQLELVRSGAVHLDEIETLFNMCVSRSHVFASSHGVTDSSVVSMCVCTL